jgi:hypothetical protein
MRPSTRLSGPDLLDDQLRRSDARHVADPGADEARALLAESRGRCHRRQSDHETP